MVEPHMKTVIEDMLCPVGIDTRDADAWAYTFMQLRQHEDILAAIVRDPSSKARHTAVMVLEHNGPSGRAAIDALIEYADESNGDGLFGSVPALAKANDTRARRRSASRRPTVAQ